MLERIKQNRMGVLLCAAVTCTVLSAYTVWIPLVALLALLLSAGAFAFCDYTKKSAHGRVLYSGIFIAFTLGIWLSFQSVVPSLLYSSGNASVAAVAFLLVLCCFYIGSAMYYFTKVHFRPAVLLLLLFIPITVYARDYEATPIVYIVIDITLYFLLLADEKRAVWEGGTPANAQVFVRGLSALAVLLLVFTLALPKARETPYQNFRERVSAAGGTTGSQLGDANSFARNTNRVLLYVEADEPLYLDYEVHSDYQEGNWVKARRSELSQLAYTWRTYNELATPGTMWQLLWKAGSLDEAFAEKYETNSLGRPTGQTFEKTAAITHVQFSTSRVLHPSGTFNVSGFAAEVFQNLYGELFLVSSSVQNNAQYTVSYQSGQNQAAYQLIQLFSGYDNTRYAALLDDLERVLAGEDQDYRAILAFRQAFDSARQYAGETQSHASSALVSLAQTLTDGLDSDYAKAQAITLYFHQNDYVYDAEYQPPEEYQNDVDYFVLESKTGSCSHYATAMTMMGRAVGLNVRFVSGFYAGNVGSDGRYEVTGKNFHAYPQVFLYGMGWTTFEPTVSYEATMAQGRALEGHEVMAIALVAAFLLAAVGYLLWRLLSPRVKEFLFRRRLRSLSPHAAVLRLYNRMKLLAATAAGRDLASYTPDLLCEHIRLEYGFDGTPLISLYEKTAFSGISPAEAEYRTAVQNYQSFYSIYKKHGGLRHQRVYGRPAKRAGRILQEG